MIRIVVMPPSNADRSYLVCATPRSGSTLVCECLKASGVAGRPEEYFEALRHTGRPKRPEDYFKGVEDRSILDLFGDRQGQDGATPQSPLWSRTAYDRYLDWAKETGTTENGVFGAKMMWGYFGDFVTLVRGIPDYAHVPLGELLPTVFPNLSYIRVQRANKLRQAVSLWKAIQNATWRDEGGAASGGTPSYETFERERGAPLRFHYKAIHHLLALLQAEESYWDAFFAYLNIRPEIVLYENFYRDPEVSTRRLLEQLDIDLPGELELETKMRRQSDGVNEDWARRYGEIRLGAEFDLVPAVPQTD